MVRSIWVSYIKIIRVVFAAVNLAAATFAVVALAIARVNFVLCSPAFMALAIVANPFVVQVSIAARHSAVIA